MNRVTIDKHQIELPQEIMEVRPDQLPILMAFIYAEKSLENQAHLVSLLIAHELGKHRALVERLDGGQLIDLSELVAWVFELLETEGTATPWLSEFEHQGKRYFLPITDFKDVSALEFSYVDMYLTKLHKSPDQAEEIILDLVSAISRPARPEAELQAPDFDGYKRIYFNPETIQARKTELQGLPEDYLVAILHFCIRAQRRIYNSYKDIFEGEKTEGPNFGWLGVIMGTAEGGAFGDISKVRASNIHDLCVFVLKKVHDQKQIERQTEAQRPNAGS